MDRSAAYAARYVAKHIVAAGLARRCEIQIAYAIGVAEPVSVMLNTFNTEKIAISKMKALVQEIFDLRPYHIINHLNLLSPIYTPTACYGHFGRNIFPWEKLDQLEKIPQI